MKIKPTLTAVLSVFMIVLLSGAASARQFTGKEADALVKGASEVIINDSRNTISFIRLRDDVFVSETSSDEWLRKTILGNSNEGDFMLYKLEKDKLGFTHKRYKQLSGQVPVEYAMYIVHCRNGRIISANGEAYLGTGISVQPKISPTAALQKARTHVEIRVLHNGPEVKTPELVILKSENAAARLAYKLDVFVDEPMSRNWMYIDAETGALIRKINRIQTVDVPATAVTRYSGTKTIETDSLSPTNYVLRETTRGLGNGTVTWNLNNGTSYGTATNFTNTSKTWAYSYDNAALDAHYGSEMTYDHYYNNYGHNSYDNTGGQIQSYVHYSSGYVNAFWNGTVMTYGDGDGVDYSPLTSLEIVGHEITHGVTENSAALVYSGESGALNESFSDIMGNTIRFINNPTTATWLIGDQIVIPGGAGSPFRNMANPNDYNCADTYGGLYFNYGDIVHYDSGIQNFWYYLLTEGGSGTNDNGDTYTVNGIGITDANAIAYRNLTVYLTPNATFADARTYAVQSALDLFGSCSNQLIQTTNAWHAVGVGGIFSNAVVSSFSSQQNYFCTVPASVVFANNSVNATSYLWDFGDGNTSTVMNPVHAYNAAGTYTIQLIASGTASCGNSDTTTLTNYIQVTNGGGPITPSCFPATVSYCCNAGITKVEFNTISKTSLNASEGYRDNTCANNTNLVAGDPYPIAITTGNANTENVKVWIDYDNNGIFNNTNEQVFVSNNKAGIHSGYIYTPTTAVLGVPLRMRVIDDISTYTISSACYNPQNGQAEDYTVTFTANALPPLVDFIASDTIVNAGSTVLFNDLTIHAPTSWVWNFPGGSPSTSALRNPSVVYSTTGTYPVTLKAFNTFGDDSLTKTAYIHVVNFANMCATTSTTAPTGYLYDSGGPTGTYQNGENCTFLISPACASSVTLSFNSFSTESGYDYFRVYDGTNASGPLLLNVSGGSIPGAVTANSGSMFINFYTDGSVVSTGFEAVWSSVITSSSAPIADFAMNNNNPPLNVPVQFSDLSANAPISWFWDFGDGYTSTLANPQHAYAAAGTYTVQLIAYTCTLSDTISKQVVVQAAPIFSADPDTLTATVNCGDSVTVTLTVYNTGTGDLVYTSGGGVSGTLDVLAYTYGADLTEEYPHTITAINQYFTDYTLTTYNGTDATAFASALAGKQVLLLPEQESGSLTHYAGFSTAVQNFVTNGGIVVVCGSYTGYSDRIFNLGLFTGTYYGSLQGTLLNTLDTTDFITNNVPLTFSAPNATFGMNFTNPDRITLVKDPTSNKDVVSYRNIGSGKVVYVGFDYYLNGVPESRLIANSMMLPYASGLSSVILDIPTDTIAPGDSTVIQVTLSADGLYAGIDSTILLLTTNDPTALQVSIPVYLTVNGSPSIALSDSCLNFGAVMQFTSATDTVVLQNNGCDTLHISGISTTSGAFTTTATGAISIPPYSSYPVSVTFTPQTPGTFNADLIILNDDIDTLVCLTGSAFAAPSISFNPDTLFGTVNCGDSVTVTLTVYNNGGGDLIYNTMQGTGTPEVLAYTYGADLSTEYPNTLAAINQYFTSYNLTTYNGTDQGALTAALVDKQILLLPEQETGSIVHYTQFAPVVQNFINNGGIVIVCGSYTTFADRIFNLGLFTGSYYNSTQSGLLNTLDTTDFITNNVPLTFIAPNATSLMNFTNPDRVVLVKDPSTNYDVVSYRNIGSGKAIHIGFDYYLYNNEAARLISNAMMLPYGTGAPWITLDNPADTIAPGDSVVIQVTMSAEGLYAGLDSTLLTFTTNDPLQPIVYIPAYLSINGSPSVALSDSCLGFGNLMQFSVSTDTFNILNNGCDTLFISSLSTTLPEYTVSPAGPLSIPPFSSVPVAVTFTAGAAGTYNGDLIILNNDIDTLICLSATTFDAPVISVSPTAINVSLTACTDSVTIPVTIYNTGGSNLNWDITGGGNQSGQPNVLALTYGTQLNEEYQHTLDAINQNFTGYNLTTINTTNASVLQASLVNKDIFLMTEPESGTPSVYSGFAPVLQNFVNNGGTIILCAAYTPQSDCIFNTGLISGNYGGSYYGQTVNVVNTTTPLTAGVPSSFQGPNATFAYNITNSNKVKLIDVGGYDVVTYRQVGLGKVIFLAFDYYNYTNIESNIIANAMQWSNAVLPDWINVSQSADTVVPGDSSVIYVTISSAGLSSGSYNGYILINSNDPNSPLDSIAVSLTITAPCNAFTYQLDTCSRRVDFVGPSNSASTTYSWDFGDGGSSTFQDPVHTYLSSGVYAVELVVCDGGYCDSLTIQVNIPVVITPVPAVCTPGTTSYCCNAGIYNVSFVNISNASADGSEGYVDFTCTDTTTVTQGNVYPISIQTGPFSAENVGVWIDFNNDGVLGTSEKVLTSSSVLQNHSGFVIIPNSGVTLSTPLRMRVGSDLSTVAAPASCTPSVSGQFEDYTVFVRSNVGLNESGNVGNLTIQPNPFTELTTMDFSLLKSGSVRVDLYNSLGELINCILPEQQLTQGTHRYRFTVENPGLYFVYITTEDGVVVKKIVKAE